MTDEKYKGLTQATIDKLEWLPLHPEVVARIFEMNGKEKISTYYLHEHLAQEFAHLKDMPEFSSDAVQKVLHRTPPYDDPYLFRQVNPKHEDAVVERFRKTRVIRQKTLYWDDLPDDQREYYLEKAKEELNLQLDQKINTDVEDILDVRCGVPVDWPDQLRERLRKTAHEVPSWEWRELLKELIDAHGRIQEIKERIRESNLDETRVMRLIDEALDLDYFTIEVANNADLHGN